LAWDCGASGFFKADIAAKADRYAGENSDLETPHCGQTHESGIFSNGVPGAMPPSGSPIAGS
jgi:hypothetical protein